MKVTVLGAGIVGLTTAYYLIKKGHSVTVVDRADAVACGASYGNGGQLSYSFTDPINGPSLIRGLPSFLFGRDEGITINPHLRLQTFKWAFQFLAHSSRQKYHKNSLSLLKLSALSEKLMGELMTELSFDFSYLKSGKLVLYENEKDLDLALSRSDIKNRPGMNVERCSLDEAINIEPGVKHIESTFKGAIFSETDAVGNAHIFCKHLHEWLKRNETKFLFGTTAKKINPKTSKILSIETNNETLEAESVVVCLGADTGNLITTDIPIEPVRGYSLTLPLGKETFSTSMTLTEKRILFSRLGNKIRITGFADFVGFKEKHIQSRINTLIKTAQAVAPHLADYESGQIDTWSGLRPLTPSSVPIIGPTKIKGLYMNAGHGFFGWTLACGSGYTLADSIISSY